MALFYSERWKEIEYRCQNTKQSYNLTKTHTLKDGFVLDYSVGG